MSITKTFLFIFYFYIFFKRQKLFKHIFFPIIFVQQKKNERKKKKCLCVCGEFN